MHDIVLRLVIALTPLALSPLLAHAIAGGWLDFGGGEKGLAWLAPWVLWSSLFAGGFFVSWYRGRAVLRCTASAALIGLAGVLAAALMLASLGQLGIAGRY